MEEISLNWILHSLNESSENDGVTERPSFVEIESL